MNPHTRQLQALGQSLWLDSISRSLLQSGQLARCIAELSISGLTSNPTIFERAFAGGDYDDSIRALHADGVSGEALFFELALRDLAQAADLLRPAFDASGGIDGWVSLEVSPLLADNTAHTIAAAAALHRRMGRPNVLIKIPGTPEGLRAVEEVIFDGVPVNVTLLFTREQWQAAAEAWLHGLERRLETGLDLQVASVASMFVSRWDTAVRPLVPPTLQHRLGISMARCTYRAHRELLLSARWQRLARAGARPQRLLWASTGSKDPATPDTCYVKALAAPGTIVTLPEKTLQAWADHGLLAAPMPADGGDAAAVLAEFRRAGVDVEALGQRLQREGVEAFALSWHLMLTRIAEKCQSDVPATPGC